jgi:hypothetical protein
VNGQSYRQPLIVKMDPRVHTTPLELRQLFALSMQIYNDVEQASKAIQDIRARREKLKDHPDQAELDKKLAALEGGGGGGRGGGGGGGRFAAAGGPDTFASVRTALSGLLTSLQNADAAPTTQVTAAAADRHKALAALQQRLQEIR